MFWYFKMSLYTPTLKFVNTTNMAPCLYTPPNALACFTYLAGSDDLLEKMVLEDIRGDRKP